MSDELEKDEKIVTQQESAEAVADASVPPDTQSETLATVAANASSEVAIKTKRTFAQWCMFVLTAIGMFFKNRAIGIKNWFVNYGKMWKTRFANFKPLTPKEKAKSLGGWALNNAIYIIIVVFIIVVFASNTRFLSFASIINIITQSAPRLIMALGIAGIIVLTGTDLSAGRCMGLLACIIASLLQSTAYPNKMFGGLEFGVWLIPIALLIAVIIGGLVGAFNGFFVAKFQLHPFIVTLATQLILYGAVMWYITLGVNNGQPIAGLDPSYQFGIIGGFEIGGVVISNLLWIAVAVTVIMWFVWNKTKLGKNMFAVGCNPEAATVSGVSVFKTILFVFIMAGCLYGVSAFIESARVGSNSTSTGVNYELDAIAACVIGGVSFMGGIGKIRGVILGVVLLQLVNAGLVFLQLSPAIQTIAKGAIILIACAIDMRKYIARK